jgi:hypothetical protein
VQPTYQYYVPPTTPVTPVSAPTSK